MWTFHVVFSLENIAQSDSVTQKMQIVVNNIHIEEISVRNIH